MHTNYPQWLFCIRSLLLSICHGESKWTQTNCCRLLYFADFYMRLFSVDTTEKNLWTCCANRQIPLVWIRSLMFAWSATTIAYCTESERLRSQYGKKQAKGVRGRSNETFFRTRRKVSCSLWMVGTLRPVTSISQYPAF